MKILAIETSCDETALTLLSISDTENDTAKDPRFTVRSHIVLSQIELHKEFGGVFPNLAKREHAKNSVPILIETLKNAGMYEHITDSSLPSKLEYIQETVEQLLEREAELYHQLWALVTTIKKPDIDYICVTNGPGLEPALWVGINFAKALSLIWDIPVVPVNHMEGHIVSVFAHGDSFTVIPPQFPALSLLISGGHTELVLVRDWMDYTKIGQTRDDAVGEAFDKVGRLLDLEYPGGPKVSLLAQRAETSPSPSHSFSGARPTTSEDTKTSPQPPSQEGGPPYIDSLQTSNESSPPFFGGATASGSPETVGGGLTPAITLPRPMIHTDDYDFSFSGLKTAVRRLVEECKKNNTFTDSVREQIALEFERSVTEVLLEKTKRALIHYNIQTLIIAGGVAANTRIRTAFQTLLDQEFPDITYLIPDKGLAGDNSLMIGMAGYFRIRAQEKDPTLAIPLEHIKAEGNMML